MNTFNNNYHLENAMRVARGRNQDNAIGVELTSTWRAAPATTRRVTLEAPQGARVEEGEGESDMERARR